MSLYFLNMTPRKDGDHEVHKEGCNHLPDIDHRIYLGQYDAFGPAEEEAHKYYTHVHACHHCGAS